LAFLLTGCQQATQKAVEQATGVQVNQKGEAVTVKGNSGETVTYSSQVPDDLKGFPAPQGFKISQGGGMVAGSKGSDKMAVATWQGKGSLQSVSDFYKKTMVDQGWKQDLAQEMGELAQFQFSKGQNQATVIVTSGKEDLTIQVMLTNTATK